MKELWARTRAAWDNLSLRERTLLSVAGGALALVLFTLLIVNPVFSATGNSRARMSTAEQQLQSMLRLRREHDEVSARLRATEARIRKNKERRNILSLLEAMASKANVNIDSIEERQASDDDQYRETRVEVSLKNVTISQIVNYLHNVESSERLFSVKGLRIKTRPDKPDLLDVNFTVSAFEPI